MAFNLFTFIYIYLVEDLKIKSLSKIPAHVAIIMDGNGRWAKSRGLPRNLGHKEGCKNIIEIINQSKEVGVKVLSLFAFSQENWKRPQEEINYIFKYLYEFILDNEFFFEKQNIKLLVMGDTSKLPLGLQNILNKIINKTNIFNEFIVNIGLNYGSQQEILRAINNIYKDLLKEKYQSTFICGKILKKYLYTSSLPDVDLLIRTSGEQRISNFMLWQISYAEIIFYKKNWPSFTKNDLMKCLKIYSNRNRRFGGLFYEKN
ncbi:MAG: polyprenyl diphosphate synthase [Bacilli bacterium]